MTPTKKPLERTPTKYPLETTTKYRVHLPKWNYDNPSKQLMLDLAAELEKVKIFNEDLKKVHAYELKLKFERLEEIDRQKAAIHNAALDEVEAHHDRIRAEAEALLAEHYRAEEEERKRKEEEARKEKERIEREEAEKRRREQEEAARLEAERQAKVAAEKKAAEEAEQARKAAQEEKERQEKAKREELEAAKRKEAEEIRKAKEEADRQAHAEQQKKVGGGALTSEEIKAHERYLQIHKDLKEFRASIRDFGKQNQAVKNATGDMRRAIKKCIGQLRDGKGANQQQVRPSIQIKGSSLSFNVNECNQTKTRAIRDQLEKILTVQGPTVDLRRFIAFPPAQIASTEQNVPALLIYGLNIFAKALVSGLINEAALHPTHAEPIGILAAQIFSMDQFSYQKIPMSDILWAKFRAVCPALWGFNGNSKTEEGRRALGWRRVEQGGPYIKEQEHLDRMTALGAGFAAITLRNFGKTPRDNPFPNTIFWSSIRKLLHIPPSELSDTHVMLIKAMLQNSGERIIGFWGVLGTWILRKAVIDLPAQLPQTMAVHQLRLLQDTYRDDRKMIF
ncbi:hypothetical protein N7532_011322 [Penicillium argentinense]|uniref:mRNA export factor GLE1 n=1 Tax=Penicillium argentinense TaxID=1131581 RepID=A0A9W9EI83_9EURO|nr:uncharacterized protein N7532_011322 [Penicillium argentinense]KAJ5082279.1 hypothetical protein N7532_011322 [Penicillium argentinense]